MEGIVADLGRLGLLPLAAPAGAGRSVVPCSFETASALSTQSENMSTGSVKSIERHGSVQSGLQGGGDKERTVCAGLERLSTNFT